MAGPSIYLDNHATTRCDPRVVEAMLPYFSDEFGNANSLAHAAGIAARDAVEMAREVIARAIGAESSEIILTSGATESNNLAIRGVAERKRRRGDYIVSTRIEHPSVLQPLDRLRRHGFHVTLVNVAPQGGPDAGCVDLDELGSMLAPHTLLVSTMLANNEIGTIEPILTISQLCRAQGIPLHCDATQAVGKLPVNVDELGVDFMSFSAHKLFGPKGVGALYVRRPPVGIRIEPQIIGGGQQWGRRSGTLNVPGIVGFAKAMELCQQEMASEWERLGSYRDDLAEQLCSTIEDCEICGPALEAVDERGTLRRLANNLNLLIGGIDAQLLVERMPNIALSSGAACSSTSPEPSHVLRALGIDDDRIRGSLRIGLGRFNSAEEIPQTVDKITEHVAAIRACSR